MSKTGRKNFEFQNTELSQDALKADINRANANPNLTLITNHSSTPIPYNLSQVTMRSEGFEVVERITWIDVERVLSDGNYCTARVIANRIGTTINAVKDILSQNSDKITSPRHRVPKTQERLYALKSKRDLVYETFRPLQAALESMF